MSDSKPYNGIQGSLQDKIDVLNEQIRLGIASDSYAAIMMDSYNREAKRTCLTNNVTPQETK